MGRDQETVLTCHTVPLRFMQSAIGRGQVVGTTLSTDDIVTSVESVLAKRGETPLWLLLVILRQHHPEMSLSRLQKALDDNQFTRFEPIDDGTWRLRPEAELFDPDLASRDLSVDVDHPTTLRPWPWQQRALDAWRGAGCRGVVEAVTGTGKTRVGLLASFEELRQGRKVQVLVPTVVLQRQWRRAFEQALPGLSLGYQGGGSHDSLVNHDVLVSVINSAAMMPARELERPGLLVADECHRYGAPTFAEALDGRFDRRLGLTATYDRNDTGCEDYLDPYFGSMCFKYPYTLAVPEEVVAPFAVALLRVDFSAAERRAFDRWADKASKARQSLIYECGLTEEPFGEFIKEAGELAASERYWEPCVEAATNYLKAFSEKRRILAECTAKYDALPQLADAVKSAAGTLVFTETIEGSEDAAARLRSVNVEAYPLHSGMSDNDRDELLRRFARGYIDAVCAPKVLDEGLDVPAADLAIILGATQTKRQMIQRMGRILRKKDGGKIARFALLVVGGTAEDPTRGGHQGFLDEVVAVCVDLRQFHGCPQEAVEFLASSQMSDEGQALWTWSQLAGDDEIGRLSQLQPDPNQHDRTIKVPVGSFPDLHNSLQTVTTTRDGAVSVPRRLVDEAARLARLQISYRKLTR